MAEGLSDRAAAQLAGVSHTAIAKARHGKRLRLFPDGSVDPAGLDEWQRGRRAPRGGKRRPDATADSKTRTNLGQASLGKAPPSTDGPIAENAAAAFAATLATGGVFLTRGDAEKARDSYVAHLRQLEYERERGKLIEIEKVGQAWEADFSQIRTRLLAIPAEHAPQLHRCRTVLELQDALMSLVIEALEELSHGGAQKFLG